MRAARLRLRPDMTSKPASLTQETPLTGDFDSYFNYQRAVGRNVVVPALAAHIDLHGLAAAEFGCHSGGIVQALAADGRVASCVGYELNADVLAASPFVGDESFRLEHLDLLELEIEERFDVVLLCEVLEHIPDTERLISIAVRALRPGGHLLVTFPPYWSAFGGHQQVASTRLRLIPYAHYLPNSVFFRLAAVQDNAYMRAASAIDDMASVRRTRLTLGAAERAFTEAGLQTIARELWLVRPEHEIRFNMRRRRARLAGRTLGLREVVVTGAMYLLRRP